MTLPAIAPIGGLGAAAAPPASSTGKAGPGFDGALSGAIDRLDTLQQQASAASESLATGQATDVTSVVDAVERASLALQLAVQVRDKAVDAYQELFRMQI